MQTTTTRRTRWALFFASLFIAISAWSNSAEAQIKLGIGGASPAAASPASPVVTTPRVRAELVAQAPDGIAPGKPLQLGLLLEHQPEWHTYWKNPGDSGLPTQLDWQLPAGWDAGEIAWPTPHPIRIGSLVNYGYEGKVLLPVPVQVSTMFAPAAGQREVTVQLHAQWLVCRVECIPEQGDFSLTLPLAGTTALFAADFAAAAKQAPVALKGESRATVDGDFLQLSASGLPAALQGQPLTILPEQGEALHHAMQDGKDLQQSWSGATWQARVPLSASRGPAPEALPLVLTTADHRNADGAIAWRTEAALDQPWTAAARAEVSPALQAALAANAAGAAPAAPAGSSPSLWLALLGGLLGGLILNLMPCVFPILAIKVLGFASHGSDLGRQRASGLAYTAGVVLSFLALGALLLALRAAGQQLGWGFQLQSPLTVAVLAALFTVIGLNLAGVFEFGHFLPSSLAGHQARHPVVNAFLSGVLAVAVASPCTAPFMGASMGLAVSLPTAQALLVFAALGVGMALPYLLASWVPAVARWLPRPGAWMDTFRRAMAFPMFATVVWLVWVLGQQSGIDGAATLLALLVALAAVVWALTLAGRTRWVLATAFIAVSAALVGASGKNILQAAVAPAQAQAGGDAAQPWQPWSADRVAQALAQQQPVFVDFTAAWCVTCQYNKRTTLSHPDVLAGFAERKVELLRADWTRQDPAITAALSQLGRSGVPVYVLYAPGKPPVVLSEILSTGEVLEALRTL
ncbi:protein-disulfide reductase DsbD family protein [Comamonas humi]